MNASRPSIPALTSVRFAAALWVGLLHMVSVPVFHGPRWFERLAGQGYLGVNFFFVLSGFVMVYAHLDRPMPAREFWRARFARIYPAYAFTLLLTAPRFFYLCLSRPAALPEAWQWPARHLAAATLGPPLLLQAWVPPDSLAWHMPAWTLSVEAFFYFLFPFLLPAFARLKPRGALIVIASCCALGFGAAWAFHAARLGMAGGQGEGAGGAWEAAFACHPLSRIWEFLIGMATAMIFLRARQRRALAWPSIALGAAGVAVYVARGGSEGLPIPVHAAMLAPLFALMIYGMALRPAGTRWLEHRTLVLWGDASYSFYLLHASVFGVLAWAYRRADGSLRFQNAAGFLVLVAAALAVSVATYRWIEIPLRRRLRPARTKVIAAVA